MPQDVITRKQAFLGLRGWRQTHWSGGGQLGAACSTVALERPGLGGQCGGSCLRPWWSMDPMSCLLRSVCSRAAVEIFEK